MSEQISLSQDGEFVELRIETFPPSLKPNKTESSLERLVPGIKKSAQGSLKTGQASFRGAHQNFFGVFTADDVGEIAEVGGANLSDVKERVDAECGEAIQKHGLGHLLADQRSHLAQKLNKKTNLVSTIVGHQR